MFLGKKKDASQAWEESTGGSELRQHPRLGIRTIVEIRTETGRINCRLADLSLGGLSFHSPWLFQPNDTVFIILPPPEGVGGHAKTRMDPTQVETRVCRCARTMKQEGWVVGVRFVNTSKEADAVIRLWFMAFGEAAEKRRSESKSGPLPIPPQKPKPR